ncbi:hypothetical protein [Tropicimonas sp. IMCC34043]|uniref:hypothetical protein n=1 Tax=Tropicimonas sp. IMCC34043 TaxID=2248760 RepID=UPI000E260C16|nr:hypothetical protein [Tropicimonas sp. IMCC34043]
MRAPSITAQVIAHLAREGHAVAEADVISALQTFEDVWGQLFPAEQTRIVQLQAYADSQALGLQARGARRDPVETDRCRGLVRTSLKSFP